jgi:hypothetical protein
MLVNAQTVSVQLEYVRPAVPKLFGLPDTTFSMIEKRPVEKVSTRTARIPLKVNPGGNSGAADFDGGDMGRGSAAEHDHALITPLGAKHVVEISKLAEFATDSKSKAVSQVTKDAVTDGMKTFRRDIDTWLQTAGNGVLGTILSGGGTSTWVLTSTPFGARLLRKNLTVGAYNAALTVKSGEATINSKPIAGLGKTQTVTVDADPGTTDTDLIVVSGLSGATPTWVYGIPYHHNTATTGTWMGISRANDYAVANGVNAANATFSLPPFRLAPNQILQELGDDPANLSGLLWHCHMAGVAGYEEYGLSLQNIQRTSASEAMPDLLFDMKQSPKLAGFPMKKSNHADPTRFDLMNLNTWGRVEWKEIGYLDIGGQTVFPVYGDSGGIASAYLFYFITGFQFFVDNPKAISSVLNVTPPSGYTA